MVFLPKRLKNLFLTINTIVIVFIATLSFAEEVVFTSIMPELETKVAASSGTYAIVNIDAELTVTNNSPAVPTTFHTIPWKAPRSGPILLTWHSPGLNVVAADPIMAGWGHLNFRVELSGKKGIIATSRSLYQTRYFLGGFLPIPPISDGFIVKQGVDYDIELRYWASLFQNLQAELLNAPGKRSIIEITYLHDALEHWLRD